jgi:threonine/homoserine/homoserine lactone efflux protein
MLEPLLPLFGVWLLAVVTPGPDFLVVVQSATARSRRHGLATGLGVCAAMLIWATGSMLGLSVLLARLSWLYDTIRLAGAAYLIFLGVRALWATRRRRRDRPVGTTAPRRVPPWLGRRRLTPRHDPGTAPVSLARAWRTGFLTNIGNPKAAAFFGSLLGALLPAGTDVAQRAVAVAGLVAIPACWYAAVALLFGLPAVARVYDAGRRWIDRVTAAILVALGARLAVQR